ncbi:MAG: hypothetical protein QME32_02955 [Endomicrobiia bacterium]|nr:hypothetical protein [Endomicrobiia bacterium]
MKAKKGFSYYIEDEMLKEYKGFSVEQKLSWLVAANDLEQGLGKRTRKLHDKFRKALI